MSEHVYKHIEVTGSSTTSSDDAIEKASASVRHLWWFEVMDLRGDINDSSIAHWQATVKIGFRIDD